MHGKREARKAIKEQLGEDPQMSNRSIAAALDVNDKLVAAVRSELEASAQIPVVSHIRCADGRLRPRKDIDNMPTPAKQADVLPFTLGRYAQQRAPAQSESLSVLGQIRAAFTSHPLAFLVALPFGAFVPIAVWSLAHREPLQWWTWAMIAGGALFSSLTVISWGRRILTNPFKALGFAVLVEGVMLTSTQVWLSLTALALLITINATSCAVALALDDKGQMR